MSVLSDLIDRVASAAIQDGITARDFDHTSPTDPLVTWLRANVTYRPDQEFFVAFLTACRIGERLPGVRSTVALPLAEQLEDEAHEEREGDAC